MGDNPLLNPNSRQHLIFLLLYLGGFVNFTRSQVPTTKIGLSGTAEPRDVKCPFHSCKGNCGQGPILIQSRPCSCAETCELYSNCCSDFYEYCLPEIGLQPLKEVQNSILFKCGSGRCYHCQKNPYVPEPFFAVSRCPQNSQVDLVQKCENVAPKLIENIPVKYQSSHEIYKNMFCAMCHRQDVNMVEPLQLLFLCNNTKHKLNYIYNAALEDIKLNELTEGECNINFIFDTDWRLEHCVVTDIDNCSENTRCNSFSSPIIVNVGDSVMFLKNAYCRKCITANKAITRASCWNHTKPIFQVQPHGDQITFSRIFDLSQVTEQKVIDVTESVPMSNLRTPKWTIKFHVVLGSNENSNHQVPLKIMLDHLLTDEYGFINVSSGECVTHSNRTQHSFTIESIKAASGWIAEFEKITLALRDRNIEICQASISAVTDSQKGAPGCNFNIIIHSLEQLCIYCARMNSDGILMSNTCENCTLHSEVTDSDGDFVSTEGLWFSDNRSSLNGSLCDEQTGKHCVVRGMSLITLLNQMSHNQYDDAGMGRLIVVHTSRKGCLEEGRNITLRESGVIAESGLQQAEYIISIVGNLISFVSLTICIFGHYFVSRLKSISSRCMFCFLVSLMIAETMYLLRTVVPVHNSVMCQTVAILGHFAWLSVFSWTNIMAIDLCHALRTGRVSTRYAYGGRLLYMYCTISYLTPGVFVLVCICLDRLNIYSVGYRKTCWIGTAHGLLFLFIVPVAIHIVINIIAFGIIVRIIQNTKGLGKKLLVFRRRQETLYVYVRLSALLGFTWTVGFIANVFPLPILWFSFSVVNSFQGFLVCWALRFFCKVFTLLKSTDWTWSKSNRARDTGVATENDAHLSHH